MHYFVYLILFSFFKLIKKHIYLKESHSAPKTITIAYAQYEQREYSGCGFSQSLIVSKPIICYTLIDIFATLTLPYMYIWCGLFVPRQWDMMMVVDLVRYITRRYKQEYYIVIECVDAGRDGDYI